MTPLGGYYDIWIYDDLQLLVEEMQRWVPNSHSIKGWTNGLLYAQTNEAFGILPIPDTTRIKAALQRAIPDSTSSRDSICCHCCEEKQMFSKLVRESPIFNCNNQDPDWKQAVQLWNHDYADEKTTFYKACIAFDQLIDIFTYKIIISWKCTSLHIITFGKSLSTNILLSLRPDLNKKHWINIFKSASITKETSHQTTNPTFAIQPSAGQLELADPPGPEIYHIQPLFNSMLTEDDTSSTGNSFSGQKQRRGNASASNSHASGARRTLASGTGEHNPKKCWKCGQEECLGKAKQEYCNNSCMEGLQM